MRGFNAPGRFSRSPALVRATIFRETSVPGASFGFGTELQDDARAEAAAEGAGPDWTTTRFSGGRGRGECAIFTKNDVRPVAHKGLLRLTKGGGRGRLANPIYAPVVTTPAPSGRVTLFTTAHLPAHIETRWRAIPLPTRTKFRLLAKFPRLSPVIATYLEALLVWKREVMDLAAQEGVDDVVVGADWNLSSFAKWVHQFIEATWPGLVIAATKGPDLGKRNVGWLLTSMDLVSAEVVSSKASDHRVGRFQLKHLNAPPVEPKPKTPPPPFSMCTYSGVRMDHYLKTGLQTLERGHLKDLAPLTVYQGDWHPGVSASGGTHDRSGVVDLAPFEFGRKVKAWRDSLGPGWHRPEIPGLWGEHCHMVIESCPKLAPLAATQVIQYHQGLDGLADHARDPNQHHPRVEWDYETAWHEIND